MVILVTGATGNVGRMLVDQLLAAGEADVRALTVSPHRAALPAGVDVVVGQVGRPATVRPALEGVDRMYLAPNPSTAREVAAMAAEAGVRRIVDMAGEEGGLWHTIEGDVEASGVAWTHLEPGEFMSNALAWADEIRTEGAVRDAYPQAANAPVDMRDIAAVAAAALLRDDHEGRRYPLTGPQSLTRAQWVAAIGAALGRDVPFIELTHEEAIAHKAAHMGEELARWFVEGRAALVEHPQQANPTVEEVLGRPATTFAQWARDNVDAFRAA